MGREHGENQLETRLFVYQNLGYNQGERGGSHGDIKTISAAPRRAGSNGTQPSGRFLLRHSRSLTRPFFRVGGFTADTGQLPPQRNQPDFTGCGGGVCSANPLGDSWLIQRRRWAGGFSANGELPGSGEFGAGSPGDRARAGVAEELEINHPISGMERALRSANSAFSAAKDIGGLQQALEEASRVSRLWGQDLPGF